ncbi:GIY-YIG nuclease family protein [Streptomyces globisporus]
MPPEVHLPAYHDPDYTDWVYEQHEQGLYPSFMPARHYLGWALNSCRWDGRGFFYQPFPQTGSDTLASVVRICGGKVPAGNRRPHARTGLYRFRDEAGTLLYIGISGDPALRQTQHAADKPWWPLVMETTIEWFNNRDVALQHEAAAIRKERPTHNVQHNKRRPAA